jgi:anaerobic selenocysteine-containing dehydrogenase
MVSVDFYVNETTRHADIILPPTFALERDHYDLIFHALAIRNTAKYSLPLYDPPPDTRQDWQIFDGLKSRIEARDPARRGGWRTRLVASWLTPRRSLALGLRFGPYGPRWNPFAKGVTLSRLARQPHGVDLGPLEPCLPERLASPDKRIELAPPPLLGDIERLNALLEPRHAPAPDQLLLIGRRDLRTNNSWMHNSRRMVKGPPRCTLMMNPQDAASRGMTDGSLARVESRVGRVEIQVEITDDLMPGVVSIPHGWGHHRPGIRLGVAREHAGVSVNDLTDETAIDTLCGNAALNGVPVSVQPAERSAATALA